MVYGLSANTGVAELNALKEFDAEIRIYRAIAEEKFSTGEGRVRTPVNGSVSGGMSPQQRIQAEMRMEDRSIEHGRSVVGRV